MKLAMSGAYGGPDGTAFSLVSCWVPASLPSCITGALMNGMRAWFRMVGEGGSMKPYTMRFDGDKSNAKSYPYNEFRDKLQRHLMEFEDSWQPRFMKLVEFTRDAGDDPNKSLKEFLLEKEEEMHLLKDPSDPTKEIEYKFNVYKNAIGNKRIVQAEKFKYPEAFSKELAIEQKEYKNIYNDFHNNLEGD